MQKHNDAQCVKCGQLPYTHVATGPRWKNDIFRTVYVSHPFVLNTNGR